MYVLKLKNLVYVLVLIIVSIVGFLNFSASKLETIARVYNDVIVIDAGHGIPDGGASANGILEADLNLEIANIKLRAKNNLVRKQSVIKINGNKTDYYLDEFKAYHKRHIANTETNPDAIAGKQRGVDGLTAADYKKKAVDNKTTWASIMAFAIVESIKSLPPLVSAMFNKVKEDLTNV